MPLVAGIWVAIIAAGFGRMMTYDFTPAAAATLRQTDWPKALPAKLSPKPACSTLVVVLHPLCSCSRATLSELAEIVGRAGPHLTVYALFVVPTSAADTPPQESSLWTKAQAIPGVIPVLDPGGKMADAFGANTSGQTYLYDADGQLRFAGGITIGRGLIGDNDGLIDVEQILQGNAKPAAAAAAGPTTTPVFGCDLR